MCICCLACLLLVVPASIPAAEKSDDLEKAIETLQPDLDRYRIRERELEARLNRLREEEFKLVEQLKNTEADVSQIKRELEDTDTSLQAADRGLIEVQGTLVEAEKELESRRRMVAKRLKSIYKRKRVGELGLLLNAKEFNAFTLRYRFLRRLIKEDARLFKELEEVLTKVRDKRKEREKHKEDILFLKDKKAAELQTLEVKKKEVTRLREMVESKKEVLTRRAEDNRKAAESLVKKLAELKDEREQMLEEERQQKIRQAKARVKKKIDKLQWPIGDINMIVSPFGQGIDPAYGTPRFNAGIDIHASPGLPILSAAEGVVLYKGTMAGYGKFVIVEHTSDLATVYAKLDDFMVRINQEVNTGDEIGITSKEVFHFEVRKGTNCENPLKWLPVD